MILFAKLALIASALLAPPATQSGAQWVGDRDAMSGELDALAPVTDDVWHSYPLAWSSGEASVAAKITLRYRMWRLVGEPVWTFEPKYELGVIQLGRHMIQRDATLPAGSVVRDSRPDGSIGIRASSDLLASIRLSELHFSARFTQYAGGTTTVYKNGWATAVFDRQGEWGWDVPGSPSWDGAFTTHGDELAEGEEITDWVRAETAKELWTRLDSAWKTTGAAPLEYLRCYRLKLDLSGFFARIERISPGVTRPLFDRVLPGETPEQAAQRNAQEYQVQALLNGVARDREARASGTATAADRAMHERRLAVTQRAFLILPVARVDLTEQLELEQWSSREDELRRDIAAVAREVRAAGLQTGDAKLPDALVNELQRIGVEVESRAAELSPALLRRWRALESLPTSRPPMRLVAEWTGPRLPADASEGGMELRDFSSRRTGRALARFDWWATNGERGYYLVDALTGEVMRRGRDHHLRLWGDGRYVVEVSRNDDWPQQKYEHILDLETGESVRLPGWNEWIRDNDEEHVIFTPNHDRRRIECWNYLDNTPLWTATSSIADGGSVYLYRGAWVIAIAEDRYSGEAFELATGDRVFTTEDSAGRERFPGKVEVREVKAELVRRFGAPASTSGASREYPPQYEAQLMSSEWDPSGDAALFPAPGSEPSKVGGLRYHLLR